MFDWGPLSKTDKETSDYKSVNYISNQFKKQHDKPFFLACGIYRPHVPWYVPQKYFDMFPLEDIRVPNIMQDDLADLSEFAKRELIERGGNYHKHVVEADQWKKGVQGYLASIAFADAMVGELLANLAASEYADNTIVVLWSDHGWQLGEKNHWRKFALWENVNRSVLMIQLPEKLRNNDQLNKTGQIESPVSLLDIYPTLVDLCGLPKSDRSDGKSLLPYFKGSDELEERPIITTYDYGSYSIRFKNWHFIKYLDDSEELYDLDSDPEEWTNLASNELHATEMEMLRNFIPEDPVPLPVESLLELQEHHVPPIQSRVHYESQERIEWMKRFESI